MKTSTKRPTQVRLDSSDRRHADQIIAAGLAKTMSGAISVGLLYGAAYAKNFIKPPEVK